MRGYGSAFAAASTAGSIGLSRSSISRSFLPCFSSAFTPAHGRLSRSPESLSFRCSCRALPSRCSGCTIAIKARGGSCCFMPFRPCCTAFGTNSSRCRKRPPSFSPSHVSFSVRSFRSGRSSSLASCAALPGRTVTAPIRLQACRDTGGGGGLELSLQSLRRASQSQAVLDRQCDPDPCGNGPANDRDPYARFRRRPDLHPDLVLSGLRAQCETCA